MNQVRSGRAAVHWRRNEGGFLTVTVEVPVNTEAFISIPAADGEQVAE